MTGPSEVAGAGEVSYTLETVPVDGGELTVGVWGAGTPITGSGRLVVAAHGITSSHQAWSLVGQRLGADHRVVAVDLRGRGGSRDLPGPYGMHRHAADLAAVIEWFAGPAAERGMAGGPAVVVGHSMGGFVAVELARRHPLLVERLVLVDGGAPLPVPPGIEPDADEQTIADVIARTVGAAFDRLTMTFPDREAYRQMWRDHPSFVDWTEAMTAYVDYDLVGTAPALHPAARREAAVQDARDLYAFAGVEPAALPLPAIFLRAERGMLDEPDRPLYPAGYAAQWLPGIVEVSVPGVNHYTITLSPAGASAVAAAVRG